MWICKKKKLRWQYNTKYSWYSKDNALVIAISTHKIDQI